MTGVTSSLPPCVVTPTPTSSRRFDAMMAAIVDAILDAMLIMINHALRLHEIYIRPAVSGEREWLAHRAQVARSLVGAEVLIVIGHDHEPSCSADDHHTKHTLCHTTTTHHTHHDHHQHDDQCRRTVRRMTARPIHHAQRLRRTVRPAISSTVSPVSQSVSGASLSMGNLALGCSTTATPVATSAGALTYCRSVQRDPC
jgi:hypothetical protein